MKALAAHEAVKNQAYVIVARRDHVLARVQVRVDEKQLLPGEVELELDCAFVPHDSTPTSGYVVCLAVADKWAETHVDEGD